MRRHQVYRELYVFFGSMKLAEFKQRVYIREHSRVIVRIIHRIQDRNIVTIYSKQFLISISNIQIFFLLNSFLLLLLFLHADFGISIFGYISQQRLKRTEIFIAVCETITLTAQGGVIFLLKPIRFHEARSGKSIKQQRPASTRRQTCTVKYTR